MYNWLLLAYPKGWANIDHCRKAVELKSISKEQYKEITGQDF
jgi:hypothetical protein